MRPASEHCSLAVVSGLLACLSKRLASCIQQVPELLLRPGRFKFGMTIWSSRAKHTLFRPQFSSETCGKEHKDKGFVSTPGKLFSGDKCVASGGMRTMPVMSRN